MPRRNRNAHAPAIDTDELAEQAAQLTAELDSIRIHPISYPAEEIPLRLSGTPGAGKSTVLIRYFSKWAKEHPGGTVAPLDGTSVFAMRVTGHDR